MVVDSKHRDAVGGLLSNLVDNYDLVLGGGADRILRCARMNYQYFLLSTAFKVVLAPATQ
jgi:hypothetical protein